MELQKGATSKKVVGGAHHEVEVAVVVKLPLFVGGKTPDIEKKLFVPKLKICLCLT